jgi:CysZ protein
VIRKLIRRDHLIKLVMLIPFAISIALYSVIGKLLFVDFKNYGINYLETHFAPGGAASGLGTIMTALVVLLLTLILFVLVNSTFILIVSLFSSPFNDIISERCERQLTSTSPRADGPHGIGHFFIHLFKVIVNEIKKISLILLLMMAAFLLGLIPLFLPFALLCSSLLVAMQFLDYNWSRHNYRYVDCLKDLRKNIVTYFIAGAIFLLFLSLPYISVFFLPFGVVYFSVLWQQLRKFQ